jgi:hypothetical protein
MDVFIILCKKGKSSDIINKIKNIQTDLKTFKSFFKILCEYNLLEYAILLYQKSIENNVLEINNKIQIICDESLNIYFDDLFNLICLNGHLEVTKWLFEIKPDINISNNSELPFRSACEKGHLKIAKWLLKIKPDINISINNDFAFRWACIKGHLKVAKWLLEIKPDINISSDENFAFILACNQNHLEIAKFLSSLLPKNYIILNYSKNKIEYEIIISLNISEYINVSEFPECCICFENSNLKTICNHDFCEKCINILIKQESFSCPICRKKLKDMSFIKLIK